MSVKVAYFGKRDRVEQNEHFNISSTKLPGPNLNLGRNCSCPTTIGGMGRRVYSSQSFGDRRLSADFFKSFNGSPLPHDAFGASLASLAKSS
jgi:hypothetical protein